MKRFIILFLLFPALVNAQGLLSLKEAIDTALKNNLDIQIAKNKLEISHIQNTYGMAGGFPFININSGDQFSVSNTDQKYKTGTENHFTDINNNRFNAGISAGITLFNGFKVIATKEKLNLLEKKSELALNQEIQNTLAAVMIKYYDIIRQQNYLKIIQNTLDVNNKKLEIISAKEKVGMSNAIELLQAEIDVNMAQQNLKSQELIIEEAKGDLRLIMNMHVNSSFTIEDSIVIDDNIQKDSILFFLKENPNYLTLEQQLKINQQIVKEITALRYPAIKMNTSYDFYRTTSNNASLLINQDYGPSVGLTLQFPLFNGAYYKKQRQTAIIDVTNTKLAQESLLNTIMANAENTYNSYVSTLGQINIQKENYLKAKKLVDIIMQNFQLNQSTILEVKTAQTSLENVSYLLTNLQFACKSAEIELKQLIFQLGN